jgi:hypothetical protein
MNFDEKQQQLYGALERIDVMPMLLDHAGTALQQLQQPILPQPAAHLSLISLICENLSSTLQLQGSITHTAADSSAGQNLVQGVAPAGGCYVLLWRRCAATTSSKNNVPGNSTLWTGYHTAVSSALLLASIASSLHQAWPLAHWNVKQWHWHSPSANWGLSAQAR